MRAASAAGREARAREVLGEAGVAARVRSLGLEGEIAAVAAPASLEAVQRLAPRLRALGYRYVALDLAAEDGTEE